MHTIRHANDYSSLQGRTRPGIASLFARAKPAARPASARARRQGVVRAEPDPGAGAIPAGIQDFSTGDPLCGDEIPSLLAGRQGMLVWLVLCLGDGEPS